MAGPYSRVTLVTGDYFTQSRQNQMDENEAQAHERTAHYMIPCDPFTVIRKPTQTQVSTVETRILVDGTQVHGASTSEGQFKFSNIDISSVSVGLHTLQVRLYCNGGALQFDGPMMRFYRHEYMNRLTIWGGLSIEEDDDNVQTTAVSGITVINHEVNESL